MVCKTSSSYPSRKLKNYTISIMTTKVFCVNIRYSKKKSGSGRNGSEKGKQMFTVTFSSNIDLKKLIKPSLDRKEEWVFDCVCSDKNKLKRNTVAKDVGLS